jgi:hypothetical protein
MAEAKKAGCIAGAVALMGAIGALLTGIADFGGLFKSAGDSPPSSSGSSPAASGATQPQAANTPAAPATVYYQGHLEFGRFNFDLKPPKRTGDTYVWGGGGVFESYHDAAKMAVWTSSGTPDRAACASAVDEQGKTYLSGTEKGNHVCGRTAEGRVFRIDVTGVAETSDGGATGDVTVWDK